MMGSDSDASEAYDWPEDLAIARKLSAIEQEMLCPICAGFVNNPHILNCGHSYCSICIRKHFDATLNRTSAGICPSCREKADSFDLKKNTTLASVVRQFRSLRKDLMELIQNKGETSLGGSGNRLNAGGATGAGAVERALAEPKSEGTAITERHPHFAPHGQNLAAVKKYINKVEGNSRVRLRMDGDRAALERRLREVVHLINAQVDSPTPLTLEQAIRQINASEMRLDKEAFRSSRAAKKVARIKNGEILDDVEEGFATLVQKVRAQKNKRKSDSPSPSSSSSAVTTHADQDDPVDAEAKEQEEQEEREQNDEVADNDKAEADKAALPAVVKALVRGEGPAEVNWGSWRVVMSSKYKEPFFYNECTGLGQFRVPEELLNQQENEQLGEGKAIGAPPPASSSSTSASTSASASASCGASSARDVSTDTADLAMLVEATVRDRCGLPDSESPFHMLHHSGPYGDSAPTGAGLGSGPGSGLDAKAGAEAGEGAGTGLGAGFRIHLLADTESMPYVGTLVDRTAVGTAGTDAADPTVDPSPASPAYPPSFYSYPAYPGPPHCRLGTASSYSPATLSASASASASAFATGPAPALAAAAILDRAAALGRRSLRGNRSGSGTGTAVGDGYTGASAEDDVVDLAMGETEESQESLDGEGEGEGESAGAGAGRRGGNGSPQWSCKSCTYLNQVGVSACEMCGTTTTANKARVSYGKDALYDAMRQNSKKLSGSKRGSQSTLSQQKRSRR
ncbi:hypothetical protein B484DRAFT_443526 [Ochromonadaceae sp. CCMP2298]|nr:hypothetical protein B484DRAFT_443526 [Ochromonadaceae sp. CCMP2298]